MNFRNDKENNRVIDEENDLELSILESIPVRCKCFLFRDKEKKVPFIACCESEYDMENKIRYTDWWLRELGKSFPSSYEYSNKQTLDIPEFKFSNPEERTDISRKIIEALKIYGEDFDGDSTWSVVRSVNIWSIGIEWRKS
jgi:hypothetical protein